MRFVSSVVPGYRERNNNTKDRAESSDNHGREIENGKTLLNLMALVPGSDDEYEGGEEAGLEEAKV